jgi:spore coat polysaccharide biosynthesis protein SpsF
VEVAAIVLAIIQARTSSSRFPRKVLQDLHGKPMLARQIERVRRAKLIDWLVVATSNQPDDAPICMGAPQWGADVWPGDLHNVFDRLYRCAVTYGAAHVVRLTGDCPLADPGIIDEAIALHLDGHDYTSNVMPCTYPDGLDVEVFTFAALEQAAALLRDTREHVTTLFRRWPRWKIARMEHTPNLSHLRWTVDYPADLEKVRRVYAALYDSKPDFSWLDVLEWEGKHGGFTHVHEFKLPE